MESISIGEEAGGAGGTNSYSALKRLDKVWTNICSAEAGDDFVLNFILYIKNDMVLYHCRDRFDMIIQRVKFDIAETKPPQVVTSVEGAFKRDEASGKSVEDFDVLVCGGTLGIFIATALCAKGLKVGIVERNILKGVCYENSD